MYNISMLQILISPVASFTLQYPDTIHGRLPRWLQSISGATGAQLARNWGAAHVQAPGPPCVVILCDSLFTSEPSSEMLLGKSKTAD